MKRRWIKFSAIAAMLWCQAGSAADPQPLPPQVAAPGTVVEHPHEVAPHGVTPHESAAYGYGAPVGVDGYGGDPKGPRNVRWGYYPGVYGHGKWGTYYRPWRGNYRPLGTEYQPPYYGWHGPSARTVSDGHYPWRIN